MNTAAFDCKGCGVLLEAEPGATGLACPKCGTEVVGVDVGGRIGLWSRGSGGRALQIVGALHFLWTTFVLFTPLAALSDIPSFSDGSSHAVFLIVAAPVLVVVAACGPMLGVFAMVYGARVALADATKKRGIK